MVDLFQVRLAGVPFDVLGAVGTPEVAEAARALLAAVQEVDAAITAARERSPPLATAFQAALNKRKPVPTTAESACPELDRYARALAAQASASADLERLVEQTEFSARDLLRRRALEVLPDFLVFESSALGEELERRRAGWDIPPSKARKVDRKLLLYLQRVCAKNDSISRFGPVGWGHIVAGAELVIRPEPGVADRVVQVERWVVRAVVTAMNADPEVRPEIAPRRHPNGRPDGSTFVRLDLDDEVPLSVDELQLLDRCDGRTPAHALSDLDTVGSLAERGVVIWEAELVAWDASPLDTLVADVAAWREGPPKARWATRLARLAELTAAFARDERPAERRRLAAEVVTRAEELGGAAPTRRGTLYAATNPIVEDCFRACGITLGEEAAATLLRDATPWLDLYRDVYSLAASHAYERLRPYYLEAPRPHGALSLASFLAFVADKGLLLHGPGLARLGAETWNQVRNDFRAELGGRADMPEWRLSAEECAFVRRKHSFPFVEEGTWPSVDLQIAAACPEAVARGDYDWVLAEIHFAIALLQHATHWRCPDRPRLHAALGRSTAGRPWLAHSQASFFRSVGGALEAVMDALPARFVAPERPRRHWRFVPPAETEVVLDDEARDLRVRGPSGEDLGSLNRQVWLFPGFHPFFPLSIAPHTPRLRMGKVVVQRETWVVTGDDVRLGKVPPRPSAELLMRIERLRAERGIPRWVFVKPTRAALDRTDAFGRRAYRGRKKDVKPFCVDLEGLLSVDVLLRRLQQYGAMEVQEMLPAPAQLAWRERDGRHTFELRAVVEPV